MAEGETPPVTGYDRVAKLEHRLYFGDAGPPMSTALALAAEQRPRIVRHHWSQRLRPGPGAFEAYMVLGYGRGVVHRSHPVGGLRDFLRRR